MNQKYANNIWKFYLFKIAGALELTIAIYVLFLLANNLSITQVMILETIFMCLILLFEIPSGIFADFFGKKIALALSLLFASISFIVFGIGTNFWVFLIAQILIAIGWSLESGADSALIYDSLKELKKEKKYAKIFGKTRAISHFTWAISALLSGFLAIQLGFRNLFFITAGLFFIGFLIALWFEEPPSHRKIAKKNYLKHLKDAAKFTYNHKTIRNLIIFFGMFAAVTHLSWLIIQPYYDFSNLPKYIIGIATFLYFASAGIGCLSANFLMNKIKKEKLAILILFIASVSLIGLFFFNKLIGLILITIMAFASGIRDVYVSKGIQENTDSHHRSTVGSIQSFSKSIMYAILAPLVGYLTDLFTPSAAFLMMGIGLFLFLIYYVIISKLKKSICI